MPVQGDEQHGRVVPEDVRRAVGMVHVPVQDQHPLLPLHCTAQLSAVGWFHAHATSQSVEGLEGCQLTLATQEAWLS